MLAAAVVAFNVALAFAIGAVLVGFASLLVAGIMALLKRLRIEGASLGARVRQRVAENFSVEMLVQRTSVALETMS